jgi:hypothetical protein
MLTYFINRAGRGLSAARKAELERAKALLSERLKRTRKSAASKAALSAIVILRSLFPKRQNNDY